MSKVIEMPEPERLPAAGPVATVPARQLTVVEYAIQNGAPPSEVRALLELQVQADNHQLALLQAKRVMDREDEFEAAKRAFAADFAEFKAKEVVTITKDKSVSYTGTKGVTEYDHATIGNVVKTITEAIAKYGFSHSWATRQQGATVYVTCTLRHKLGHFEEVVLSADSDTSGGKNSIQGIGSAITYLQRYTLLAITGCASMDKRDDDDGAQTANAETALMNHLVGEAQAIDTSEGALAYWKTNAKQLAAWPYAYEKFKQAVAAHRKVLDAAKQAVPATAMAGAIEIVKVRDAQAVPA